MRFSIITITFNAAKYLKKTCESVASQTFTDFEHIVFDGGSSDETVSIARSFPHIKVIQGHDSGISDAMNQGAKLATGEFLLHLHADDYLADKNTLLLVDTHLRQHPEVLWIYGQVEIIDEKGNRKKEGAYTPYDPKKLKKYNIIPHPACFYSRELFHQVGGFSESLRYAMDYDLWLKFSKITNAYSLPKVLSAFREHEGSVSTSLPLKVADEAHFVRGRHASNLWEKWRSYRTWKRRRRKIESV